MTDSSTPDEAFVSDEDVEAAFGEDLAEEDAPPQDLGKKRRFDSWHLPVKQFVRIRQWALQADRLLGDLGRDVGVVRYFTLPGPDLLDVRVLADVCGRRHATVELFGFDSAGSDAEPDETRSETLALDRVILRQSGRIADSSVVVRGRLEAIAQPHSQEATQLQNRWPFHIINIDACSHLTYRRNTGAPNLFDALTKLLAHQLHAQTDWLLFITTRCDPLFLSEAKDEFQRRIEENIGLSTDFAAVLAEALETDIGGLNDQIRNVWQCNDPRFLKLYSVGLGKYLLKWFTAQVASPAETQLVSALAYRVAGENPDMLALAFRIKPLGQRVFPTDVTAVDVAPVEPEQAAKVAERAKKLVDVDEVLRNDQDAMREAFDGTKALLREANFDLDAWKIYVETHPRNAFTSGASKDANAA